MVSLMSLTDCTMHSMLPIMFKCFLIGKDFAIHKIGDLNVIVEKATHPAKIGVLILHGYGADFQIWQDSEYA